MAWPDPIIAQARYRLKSILTTDPAFVIWMGIGFVELMPQYVWPQLMPLHNSAFSIHPL